MKQVTPFLWYKGQAEQAAWFYVSLFKGSKVLSVTHNATHLTGKKGKVMTVRFRLNGQEYVAFNGAPGIKFNWAFSMFVNCKDQREADRLWGRLAKGGKPLMCGWVEDRFGLCWQVVPRGLLEMIGHKDKAKAERATKAMMKMVKIDIAKVRRAFNGN